MKRSYWPFIGALVGFAAGSVFGIDYAIAGIGMAGGIAISLAMR